MIKPQTRKKKSNGGGPKLIKKKHVRTLNSFEKYFLFFQDYIVFIEQPLFVEGQNNGLRSACAGGSSKGNVEG